MSNINNSINDGSESIGRSMSNARFQIEKVFDGDSNSKELLTKTKSVPTSKYKYIL